MRRATILAFLLVLGLAYGCIVARAVGATNDRKPICWIPEGCPHGWQGGGHGRP